jgi:hypothetical protein
MRRNATRVCDATAILDWLVSITKEDESICDVGQTQLCIVDQRGHKVDLAADATAVADERSWKASNEPGEHDQPPVASALNEYDDEWN